MSASGFGALESSKWWSGIESDHSLQTETPLGSGWLVYILMIGVKAADDLGGCERAALWHLGL